MAGTITVRPTPPGSDWWANDAPAQAARPAQDWWQADSPFDGRFKGDGVPQQPNKALAAALPRAAAEMTRGEPTGPAASMAIDAGNQLSAASQGTTPHIDSYNGRLLSTETFEDDAGNIHFKDPQTGALIQTDKSKHVALRDPNDNTIKIFSRDAATNESPAVGVARVLAPGLAAGAPTARAAIAAAPQIGTKASEIFASAKPYYKEFTKEASGIEVPAQTATDLAGRIRGALDKANFIEELAPSVYKAVAILDKPAVEKKAADAALAAGQEVAQTAPMTLDALQNIKRVVGRSFSSPDKNVRDAAAVASKEITKIISEVSSSAGKSLQTADAIHSTARRLQDLQRKGAVADLRAGRAGYGGNAVNSMRQVLSPIVQRAVEGKMTGFKPDEIAAMREIVEGTTATNALRHVGMFSPSKGIIASGIAAAPAAPAFMAAGPIGLAAAAVLPTAGAISNKLAAVLTGNQIERLKELVAKRSPAYAQAVAKSVDRFERAQMELANRPAPNTFAAYLSASRALSAGLTKDGIEVTSGALLRQIAGQPPAQAESDQPSVGGGGG